MNTFVGSDALKNAPVVVALSTTTQQPPDVVLNGINKYVKIIERLSGFNIMTSFCKNYNNIKNVTNHEMIFGINQIDTILIKFDSGSMKNFEKEYCGLGTAENKMTKSFSKTSNVIRCHMNGSNTATIQIIQPSTELVMVFLHKVFNAFDFVKNIIFVNPLKILELPITPRHDEQSLQLIELNTYNKIAMFESEYLGTSFAHTLNSVLLFKTKGLAEMLNKSIGKSSNLKMYLPHLIKKIHDFVMYIKSISQTTCATPEMANATEQLRTAISLYWCANFLLERIMTTIDEVGLQSLRDEEDQLYTELGPVETEDIIATTPMSPNYRNMIETHFQHPIVNYYWNPNIPASQEGGTGRFLYVALNWNSRTVLGDRGVEYEFFRDLRQLIRTMFETPVPEPSVVPPTYIVSPTVCDIWDEAIKQVIANLLYKGDEIFNLLLNSPNIEVTTSPKYWGLKKFYNKRAVEKFFM